MVPSIGGQARLTWGWREFGNGGEAEKLWGTLSGILANLTMELVMIVCIWELQVATLDTIWHVLGLLRILFVKFSCNSVSFTSLPPSTKVGCNIDNKKESSYVKSPISNI